MYVISFKKFKENCYIDVDSRISWISGLGSFHDGREPPKCSRTNLECSEKSCPILRSCIKVKKVAKHNGPHGQSWDSYYEKVG